MDWGKTIVCVSLLSAASASATTREDLPASVRRAFLMLDECGAVKVSRDRPIYLSALHCFQHVEAVQEMRTESLRLGDLVNFDWIIRYDERLTGTTLADGRRILATGGEWTGYGLDVLKAESPEHVEAATTALQRDWVIFEDPSAPNATSDACVPAVATPAVAASVLVVGREDHGFARAYSDGHAVGPDFVSHPSYVFADAWSDQTLHAMRALIADGRFLVTDADVWPGMSGGPVVDGDG